MSLFRCTSFGVIILGVSCCAFYDFYVSCRSFVVFPFFVFGFLVFSSFSLSKNNRFGLWSFLGKFGGFSSRARWLSLFFILSLLLIGSFLAPPRADRFSRYKNQCLALGISPFSCHVTFTFSLSLSLCLSRVTKTSVWRSAPLRSRAT